jgi:4-aminobutyrate aminotransferase-like enzyme
MTSSTVFKEHVPLSTHRAVDPGSPKEHSAERDIRQRIQRLEGGGVRTFVTSDPLVIERAYGAWLYGPDGRAYLDFAGSFAVTATGHCHPKVVAAVQAQAEKLIHCPSAYASELRAEFYEAIESLCAPVFGEMKIMPAMTGGMANEMAFALVRWLRPGCEFITFSGGYYGRSVGAAGFAGKSQYREAIGVSAQAHYAPFPYPIRHGNNATDFTMRYLESLTGPGGGAGKIGAVVVEPIQGNGGVVIPPADFLPRLRAFCDRIKALLVLDEIQSGCGRTGLMWAVQHSDVVPDLMTIGKGIGGNMGVSALVGKPEHMTWKADAYSATHLTNHVALAAAIAAMRVVREEGLAERSRELGERYLARLRDALDGVAHVAEVRGRGLWFGIEITDASGAPDHALAATISRRLRDRGVIMGAGGYAGNVMKVQPALVIDDNDLRAGLDKVVQAIREG